MDRDVPEAVSPGGAVVTDVRDVEAASRRRPEGVGDACNHADDEEEEAEEEEEQEAEEGDGDGDEEGLARAHLMPQALPVAADFDPSGVAEGPALSAEEYLARVRHEAEQCPAVVRVELDPARRDRMARPQTSMIPVVEGIKEAREELLPRAQWVQSFAAAFSDLRDTLEPSQQGISAAGPVRPVRPSGIPKLGDLRAWEDYALGGRDTSTASNGHLPSTCVIQSMDQVTVTGLLERLVVRMHSHAPSAEHTLWIFSLAARLEKPLFADTLAVIRSLLRNAASCRATLADATDPSLPRLNLLVGLSGGYFCQDESLAGLMNT